MLEFPRWKIALVVLICVISIICTLPNFIHDKNGAPASWLPQNTVSLGLDLQGGVHLLLEIDFKSYVKEQLDKLKDDVRVTLRRKETDQKRIGYTGGLRITDDALHFTLRDAAQSEEAYQLLRETYAETTIEQPTPSDFIIRFSPTRLEEMKQQVMAQSIEIVRRRVDETGTREPTIQRQGDNRIILQVPGLQNPEHLKRLLGKTAKLTFHLLDENTPYASQLTTAIPSDSRKIRGKENKSGEVAYFVIKKRSMLTGDSLVDARASFQNREPVVSFRFDSAGAKKFANVTKTNVGKPFAIVLDNEVISAPVIREPILGGSGIISGYFTTQTANDLALLLRAGALPAPLDIVEERTVGPSLGADSIAAGTKATILGVILVMLFMLFTYRRFGLYANIALLINFCLITAALSLFQATLTLPGIAGIVLTLGMAVDANVLIFERIREEIERGRTVLAATDKGFKQAFKTILDSNITTLLASLILFQFGSGPVKGFAVTLSIGIISSMFSAILFTRMLIILWLNKRKPKTLPL